MVDGVVHYCVANMPAAVPLTATAALRNATLPYVAHLAARSLIAALREDPGLRSGVNILAGKLGHAAIAAALEAT
jgi:alanine dehydrogenase